MATSTDQPVTPRRSRLRVLFWLIILCVALGALVLLAVEREWVMFALRSVDPTGSGMIYHTAFRERRSLPPEWQNPKPFSPETIQAFSKFARISKAIEELDTEDALAASEATTSTAYHIVKVLRDLNPGDDLTTEMRASLATYMVRHRPPYEALVTVLRRPDFTPDIDRSPLAPDGINGIRHYSNWAETYIWSEAMKSYDAGTSAALEFYEAFRGSRPRTVSNGYQCIDGMEAALRGLPAMLYMSHDAVLTSRTLARLNATPPPLENQGSPVWRVFVWGFGGQLSQLYEMKRLGYPIDLSQEMSGWDVERIYYRSIDSFSPWLKQHYPVAGATWQPPSHEYPVVAPESILRFFCNHSLGPWSVYGAESQLISGEGMRWSHTYPFGNSVAAKYAGPYVDESRSNYDIARLNIAAVLYRLDTHEWPTRPEDLVPGYLEAVPPDPGPRGPYIWSPLANRFTLRQPVDHFGIL